MTQEKQDTEFSKRITKVIETYFAKSNGFINKKDILSKTKLSAYGTNIGFILMYGCEIWTTQQKSSRGVIFLSKLLKRLDLGMNKQDMT